MAGRALSRYSAWQRFESWPKRGVLTPIAWMSHLAGNRHHHLSGDRRTTPAHPTDGGTRVPANNQTLRPDKGRDYTERGWSASGCQIRFQAALRDRQCAIRRRLYILLLQIRTEVLNSDGRATLSHWYHGLRETEMKAGSPPIFTGSGNYIMIATARSRIHNLFCDC